MRRTTFLAAALILAGTSAFAETNYPSRPITMIVPFAAGGPTDTVGRLIAEPMTRVLGQQVLVENVGGAGGTLGAARVAKADPDGHTILLYHIGQATSVSLYRKLPYDPATDFTPVGRVTDVPMTLVTRPDMEASSAGDLLSYIAQEQGRCHPRQCRRRLGFASVRHGPDEGARRADDHDPLQGHRPRDDRPDRRTGGRDVRPEHQYIRPDQVRQHQGLWRHGEQAPGLAPRPADAGGSPGWTASKSRSGTASGRPRGRPPLS